MFKPGQYVVYPNHAVGIIKGIETKEIFGKPQAFLVFQSLTSPMKVMIPNSNVSKLKLRPVISKRELNSVIKILMNPNVKVDDSTWYYRYKDYEQRMAKGGIMDTAEVVSSLYQLRKVKSLSFGETKMFDYAMAFLVPELAVVEGCSMAQAQKTVNDALESA